MVDIRSPGLFFKSKEASLISMQQPIRSKLEKRRGQKRGICEVELHKE